MATIQASELLRPGLLEGVSVLLAGTPEPAQVPGSLGAAIGAAFAGLGAQVSVCWPVADGSDAAEDLAADDAAKAALAEAGSIEVLVFDGAGSYARGLALGDGTGDRSGRGALRACLGAVWDVTRAVVNVAFLPAGCTGRIVYLAPAPDAGEHADAARAGLENLSRTLSIEWARHGITAVTVAPGVGTSAGEVASLAAYLASPAGAYLSGCLLDLRGPAGR
jgi:NAD(P)-dependent dehydrogenase (short-subunit alcohol dehydrogenase family)